MFRNRRPGRFARHDFARRVIAVTGVLAVAAGGLTALAGPAAADVTGVGGGASGLAVSGLLNLAPTPSVTQPPGGTATAVSASVPNVVTTGELTVSSSSSGLGGPTGTVTSSAGVSNTSLLAAIPLLPALLSVGAVNTTCTSGGGGSTAGTIIASLDVAGTPVVLPNPIPPNFGLTVPGLASVQLNHQVAADSAGSTSITVDGLYIKLLGGLTTVTVAESRCSASGPDVNAAPTVTSLNPTSGPSGGGTPVTVTGTDFFGVTAVDFGGVPATNVVVDSPTQLTAVAPAGSGTVGVTVTDPHGTSATNPGDEYTYTNPPTVTDVVPNAGPTSGGQTVIIDGTGLGGVTTVDFGAVPATGVVCAATECTVTTPAGSAGTVPVTVTSPEGTSTTSPASQYTYGAGPAVTGINPHAGPAAGGTVVTISGANLSAATAVDFGTVAAATFSCGTISCTATSPPGTAGNTVDVTVVTPDGTSATSPADRFVYYGTPSVTGITPTDGPTGGGTTVTLTGTDLCGTTAVDFGTTAATSFTANVDCTQIVAVSPPGTGTVDVTVTTPGGTSPTNPNDGFTYEGVPSVLSITPISGPTAGGTAVTITGTNLLGATAVDFGLTPATSFSCSSSTSCVATSPGGPAGPVSVSVTTAGGVSMASPATQFTYVPPFPYHAVSPYRIADTRTGSGEPYAGQTLGAGGSLNVQVIGTTAPGGPAADGVPANATVAVLNVTETNATAQGHFTIYPTGDALPTASSLNFAPVDATHGSVPNLVETAIGQNGEVTVSNFSGTADVVIDVEGYVGPAASPADTSGLFNSLTPARIADTRAGSGLPYQGQTLSTGGTLDIQVTGQGGVPALGVSAVVLNVTATNKSAKGYLTVYPQGSTRPTTSNVNSTPGVNASTRVIVPVGPTGEITVFNQDGTTDVVVDVNGWFSAALAGSGQVFSGFSPVRITDTRTDSGQFDAGHTLGAGQTLAIPVAGQGGVPLMTSPDAATSVVLNVTVTDTTADSHLTVFPDLVAQPATSDLNWTPDVTKANMVVVKLGANGAIDLYNFAGQTDVIIDVVGFYAPPPV